MEIKIYSDELKAEEIKFLELSGERIVNLFNELIDEKRRFDAPLMNDATFITNMCFMMLSNTFFKACDEDKYKQVCIESGKSLYQQLLRLKKENEQ